MAGLLNSIFVASLAVGCALAQDGPRTQIHKAFELRPNESDGVVFGINRAGRLAVEVRWPAEPFLLTVELYAPGEATPLVQRRAASPLRFETSLPEQLVRNGVSWRLRLTGEVKASAGGTLAITYPEAPARRGTLGMRSGAILLDTVSTRALVESVASRAAPPRQLAFVRVRRLPKPVELAALRRAGIHLYQFLSLRTYRAVIERGADLGAGLSGQLIEAAAGLRPADKLSPRVALGQFSRFLAPAPDSKEDTRIPYVLNSDGSVNLSVIFAPQVAGSEVDMLLGRLARTLRRESDRDWTVTLDPAGIRRLARAPQVEWIAPVPPPPLPLNNKSRSVIMVEPLHAIDLAPPAPGYNYSGSGDKDLYLGAGDGTVRLFRNIGSDEAPNYDGGTPLLAGGVALDVGANAVPFFTDWHIAALGNDGDFDLLVGNADGAVIAFINAGSDALPVYDVGIPVEANGLPVAVGGNAAPILFDWDRNGGRDLLVGAGDGRLLLFLNQRTNDYNAPNYAAGVTIQAGGVTLDVGGNARPLLFDLDRDGAHDLLVGDSGGGVTWFRNNASDEAPVYAQGVPLEAGGAALDAGENAAPSLFDFDRDGLQDLAVGTAAGEVWLYRSTGEPQVFEAGIQLSVEHPSLAVNSHAAPLWRDADLDGIRVVNLEGSAEWRHGDFEGRIVARPETLPSGSSPHAGHVLGTIAGSGARSGRRNVGGASNGGMPHQWRGMLPEAGLIFLPNLATSAQRFHEVTAEQGADLINISLALDPDGEYGARARLQDDVVGGNGLHAGQPIPATPIIMAAGNAGTNPHGGDQIGYYSLNSQTKNVLLVGGWRDETSPPLMWPGSSLGPAYDGRIKPDVVAPAVSIVSVGSIDVPTVYQDSYVSMVGTSMASPAVAGVVGILQQAWRRHLDPGGQAGGPMPSSLRALIVHTAQDLDWVNAAPPGLANPDFTNPDGPVAYLPGPDFATGWGLVDASAAVAAVEAKGVVEAELDTTCEVRAFPFLVSAAQAEVRVTLAWDDPSSDPALPLTAPRLINDLDLELVAPVGDLHYPWALNQRITAADDPAIVLTPEQQPCGTAIQVLTDLQVNQGASDGIDYPGGTIPLQPAAKGRDHLNNVEQVIAAASPGVWIARVRGFAIPQGPQRFSLVGGFDTEPPTIACPASLVLEAGAPEGVAIATLDPAALGVTASDGDAPPPSLSFDVSGFLPLGGPHSLTVTARDVAGNRAACTIAVTVSDTVPPSLVCPAPLQDLGADGPAGLSQAASAWTDFLAGIEATDLVDPTPTIVSDAPDPLPLDGVQTVRLEAVDASGNASQSCDLEITVRRPADIVLVLDDTGSMNQSSGDDTGLSKIASLRHAADTFAQIISQYRQGLGDRVGLLGFKVPPNGDDTQPCQPDWSQSLIDLAPAEAVVPEIVGTAEGLAANGWATPLRAGLQTGSAVLAGQPFWRRRVMVLLTDGKQNTDNCMIGPDPQEIAAFRLENITDPGIQLLSVGFGADSQIDAGLLQQLATDGLYDSANTDQELAKWFSEVLSVILEQAVILDPKGSLTEGASHAIEFPVTSQDRSILVLLNWAHKTAELKLNLQPPGAQGSLTADLVGVTRIGGDTFQAVILHPPASREPGNWTARVTRGTDAAGTEEPFTLVVLADSPLRLRPAEPFDPAATTEFLPLQVALFGAELATDVVVTATLSEPTLGLGAALAAANGSDKKVMALTKSLRTDHDVLARRLVLLKAKPRIATASRRVKLPDAGKQHRRAPGLRRFGTRIGPLHRDGTYRVTYRAEGKTIDGEPFVREFSRGFFVPVKVSLPASEVRLKEPENGDRMASITVRPQDLNGQLLGPGYGKFVTIEWARGKGRGTTRDGGDGSYRISFDHKAADLAGDAALRVLSETALIFLQTR
ncbi:MAG: S8 family serine peptidase [Proteobacteria bacterium]|nr:S8 family serine peptidase [Pseudomonadota bacterium]